MYSLDFLIFALPLLLYKNTAKESAMETSSKPRLQEQFLQVRLSNTHGCDRRR